MHLQDLDGFAESVSCRLDPDDRVGLRDLILSEEFPHRELLRGLFFSITCHITGMISTLGGDSPATGWKPWALILSVAAIGFGVFSVACILRVIALIIFSRFDGRGEYCVARLAANVSDFRSTLSGIRAKVQTSDKLEMEALLKDLEETDMGTFLDRYYTVNRAHFFMVVACSVFATTLVFSGVYLAEFTLHGFFLDHSGSTHILHDSSGFFSRSASALYASVATLVTMGAGVYHCHLIDLTVCLQVLFTAVLIFFGLGASLAYFQASSQIKQGEILAQIRREVAYGTTISAVEVL